MTSAPPLVYQVDEHDTLISVNEAWQTAAERNEAPELRPAQVLQRSLFTFITDETTRLLYKYLLQRVRSGQVICFPFRCDGPSQRRWLAMRMTLTTAGCVSFTTHTLYCEARPAVLLLERAQPRSSTLLRLCSWCQRVAVEPQQWVEVEEAIIYLRLFAAVRLPCLTHGICPQCLDQVRQSWSGAAPLRDQAKRS